MKHLPRITKKWETALKYSGASSFVKVPYVNKLEVKWSGDLKSVPSMKGLIRILRCTMCVLPTLIRWTKRDTFYTYHFKTDGKLARWPKGPQTQVLRDQIIQSSIRQCPFFYKVIYRFMGNVLHMVQKWQLKMGPFFALFFVCEIIISPFFI